MARPEDSGARVIPLRPAGERRFRGLLPTKILPPRVRPRAIARPRLSAALADLVEHPVTLVHGPAGAGKSTALAQWGGSETRAVAWLALDASDSSPHTFIAYVLAALDQVHPGLGDAVEAVLGAPGLDAGADVLEDILAEHLVIPLSARAAPVILVLDDYHVIDSERVHSLMQWLIDHLPACLRMVIASRREPALGLARLRARGELGQLSGRDLRFRLDEATGFYNQVMALGLEPDAVAEIEARTEGWPAGAQLAALSVRAQASAEAGPDSAPVPPSGRDRLIAEYLMAEVFEKQPLTRRTLMLASAIVDRVCGPLVAAVSGREGAADELAHIARDDLFVIPLDGTWWRYHHLFGDFLRVRVRQLPGPQVQAWHRRASAWFAAEDLRQEAIDHALAAGDPDWIAELFERWVGEMIVENDPGTVLRWLAAVPAAVAEKRAIFEFARGWCDIIVGRLSAGVAAVERARARCQRDGSPPMTVFGICEMGRILRLAAEIRRGEHARVRAEVEAILPVLPAQPLSLRAAYYHTIGLCELEDKNPEAALEALRTAEIGFGNERDYVVLCLAQQAQAQRLAGRPDDAARAARRALVIAEQRAASERSPAGYARVELGWLAFDAGDLEPAKAQVEAGLARMRLLRDVVYLRHGTELLARVEHARGNTQEAIDIVDESLLVLEGTELGPSIERMRALRAELVLARAASGSLPAVDTASAHASPGSTSSARGLGTDKPHRAAPGPTQPLPDPMPDPMPTPTSDPLPDPLTEREREVLALVAHGASNREIAQALFVSVGTVKTHMHRILAKLGAQNRTRAVHKARAVGLL